MEEESTIKMVLKRLKKRIKFRHILILAILLSANTFAWFIYANKVESGITAKIRAWDVDFEINGESGVNYIPFTVDEIYPGMPDFVKTVTIINNGDSAATLSYEVDSATILGVYTEATEGGSVTPELLLNSLRNDYPFKINPTLSNTTINPGASQTFTFTLYWPFESNDDEEDTYWGSRAYDYAAAHPSASSIIITMKISAVQLNETNNN